MASGTIDIRLRPIKLAFLVCPDDRQGLLEAIQINTFLWGGMFNPIIPAFERISGAWRGTLAGNLNAKSVLAGYLDAYDPDYVIQVGKSVGRTFDVDNRIMISSSEIFDGFGRYHTPEYGIGFFEILQYFIDKELKFARREPLDIRLPDVGKQYSLFMASVFGSLPPMIDRIFRDRFEHILGVKRVPCSMSNYSEFLNMDNLFLMGISSLYLSKRISSRMPRMPSRCIFFLDATKPIDIIDYWNLRALGWNVFPMPKQASGSDKNRRLALDFVEENVFPEPFHPRVIILLKSRSTSKQEIGDFCTLLKTVQVNNLRKPEIIVQHFYPRVWNEWARKEDGAECCDFEARSISDDLPDIQQRKTLKTLDPEFISSSGNPWKPRFANEVELQLYDDKEVFAEVIPEADVTFLRQLAFHPGEWRSSKKGLVYLSPRPNHPFFLPVLRAEDVFLEWLKSKRFTVELSVPGRIAKEMLKHLGGVLGTSPIASEGMIKLLEDMSGAKAMGQKEFWGRFQKIAGQMEIRKPGMFLERLIDARVFRLGVVVQCPVCRRYSWYSLKDADYELQCSECLAIFPIPSHSPKEIRWSYRTLGPSSLPDRSYGVYSVLLTFRFFSAVLNGATTPIMSFTAQKGDSKMEADLGLFFRASKYEYSKTQLIFAECKTYNHFCKADIDRMASLGNLFPGAILTFAMLRKKLTEKEQRLLRPLVSRCRKCRKARKPFNPVLILTGMELFSKPNLMTISWERAEGLHASLANHFRATIDLLELSDATQQLYLSMKSYYAEFLESYQKMSADQDNRPSKHP